VRPGGILIPDGSAFVGRPLAARLRRRGIAVCLGDVEPPLPADQQFDHQPRVVGLVASLLGIGGPDRGQVQRLLLQRGQQQHLVGVVKPEGLDFRPRLLLPDRAGPLDRRQRERAVIVGWGLAGMLAPSPRRPYAYPFLTQAPGFGAHSNGQRPSWVAYKWHTT
jgi:hypothetical protein